MTEPDRAASAAPMISDQRLRVFAQHVKTMIRRDTQTYLPYRGAKDQVLGFKT